MSKIKTGLFGGVVVGILNLIPLSFIKVPWDAYAVAFLTSVIAGFLIATSNLKLNSVLKGILILFIIASPMMVVLAVNNFKNALHMVFSNFISGALLGFVIDKFEKKA
ncbi:MAG: hypothetical protein FD145_1371 [Candidatus Saganbacteria bacterium]|uniref:Uncharacterized protein n=1 Tax=Candidatus Saganbacteria bacterium TaxID=2575572 RepID=A0A833NWJ4_UNCSA|nr:MAG: hypothetical protein FD145_1371 [Candidatus Saganbacteria bacterium]